MDLVKINEKKELVISLGDIARGTGLSLDSVVKTIRRHGRKVGLKVPKGAYSDKLSENLTEEQTYRLLVILSNSENVLKFKNALITEFFRMRELLNSGSYIPDELKVFLPKNKFGEENKQGLIKTEPVSGYWRADNKSEKGKLLQQKYQLQKRLNGLLEKEIRAELELIENKLAELGEV